MLDMGRVTFNRYEVRETLCVNAKLSLQFEERIDSNATEDEVHRLKCRMVEAIHSYVYGDVRRLIDETERNIRGELSSASGYSKTLGQEIDAVGLYSRIDKHFKNLRAFVMFR